MINKGALSRIKREKEVLEQEGYVVAQPAPLEMIVVATEEIRVVFHQDHPFKPSSVWIGGIPYHEWRRPKSTRFLQRYIKLFEDCPCCCSSLLTKDRWSPAITVSRLIHIFRQDMMRMQTVRHSFLVESILQKNNMPDHLPISAFLAGTRAENMNS